MRSVLPTWNILKNEKININKIKLFEPCFSLLFKLYKHQSQFLHVKNSLCVNKKWI